MSYNSKCGKLTRPPIVQEKSQIELKHCNLAFPQKNCEHDLVFNIKDDEAYKMIHNLLMLLHEGGLLT